MGLKERLRRLERAVGACQVCGWGSPELEVEVVWDDGYDDVPDSLLETTYCPGCGRPDEIVIRWPEDLDVSPEERRRHEEAVQRLKEGRLEDLSE